MICPLSWCLLILTAIPDMQGALQAMCAGLQSQGGERDTEIGRGRAKGRATAREHGKVCLGSLLVMQAGCQGTWGNQAFPDFTPPKLIHTPALGISKWASSYAARALIGLLTQASGGLRLRGVFPWFLWFCLLLAQDARCQFCTLVARRASDAIECTGLRNVRQRFLPTASGSPLGHPPKIVMGACTGVGTVRYSDPCAWALGHVHMSNTASPSSSSVPICARRRLKLQSISKDYDYDLLTGGE